MNLDAQQLAALEEDLKRDLEAISRVRRLMASKNGTLSSQEERRVQHIGVAAGDNLVLAESAQIDVDEGPVRSLRGTMEQIINADTSIRWTNQKMLNHLQKTGFPLKAKKPIYSIGQAMQKLEQAGKVRVVRRGTGNTPNIYRGKESQEGGEQQQ